MKYRFAYRVIFVIFLLVGTGWLFYRLTSENGEIQVKKIRNEPSFQDDGEIYFVSGAQGDTLSVIDIEIVDKPEDIGRGLMFRSQLKQEQGMFFIFPDEEEQIFWMKNTRLSLDIIFVSRKLEIIRIAKHTLPYSTEPIPSIYPAKYVVEVNAGFCDTYQIQKLDHILYNVNE